MSNRNVEENRDNSDDFTAYKELRRFQINIAKRWLKRANVIEDIFAKFFFCFAGFNALYFLWRKIDKLDKAPEWRHIENLLSKFDESKSREILDKIKSDVDYFCQRRPIQRMIKRTVANSTAGEKDKGCEWQNLLKNEKVLASERLNAMGQILYTVRSNLVHGSKTDSGDDKEIIQKSIEPLKIFLKESILRTEALFT